MRRALLTFLVMAVIAGCGDDEEPSGRAETSTAPPAQDTTLSTPPPRTETESRTATATKTTTAAAGACRLRQLELEPLNPSVTCAEAQRVAAAYDLSGPKVQEIRGWTCATGTAATRPVVFTCTLGDREFVAREARG